MVIGRSDLVDIEGRYKCDTQKAWLIDFGLKDPVWLPKSMVEIEFKTQLEVVVTMKESLAIEKGLEGLVEP